MSAKLSDGADHEREALRSRLDDIAEALADMAYSKLSETAETGDPGAAAEERRLSRARRAVLKAAALLGDDAQSEGEA